jgi:hypothetical protein
MNFDTATVANALGIAPGDVLRTLWDFKRVKQIGFDSTDKAFSIRVHRPPTEDEFERIYAEACAAVANLEHGQLAKIDYVHRCLQQAIDERTSSENTVVDGDSSDGDGNRCSDSDGDEDSPEGEISQGCSTLRRSGGASRAKTPPGKQMSRSIYGALMSYFKGANTCVAVPAAVAVADPSGVCTSDGGGSERDDFAESTLPPAAASNVGLVRGELDHARELQVRKDVRTLLGEQTTRDTAMRSARCVARIFHGIGSPVYPSKTWYTHPMWRRHDREDFYVLMRIAKAEMKRYMTGR